MQLIKYLQAQGLGSRKQCQALVADSAVQINNTLCNDPHMEINPQMVSSLHIDDVSLIPVPLPYFYILLNKPADYETSHKPQFYPSVFSLLPEPLRHLDMQAVGRLDADTTGVLILTNDGQFNHRCTSPKHKLPKIYRVSLKHAADEKLCTILKNGVLLHDDNEIVTAQATELTDPYTLLLTITSGKYHQVKRMVAAAGNRVSALHRCAFGQWETDHLPTGEWRFFQPESDFK